MELREVWMMGDEKRESTPISTFKKLRENRSEEEKQICESFYEKLLVRISKKNRKRYLVDIEDYAAAHEKNYIPIAMTASDEEVGVFTLPSNSRDPEERVILTETIAQLSKEARFILDIVFYNSPKEIYTPKTGKLTIRSLMCYLRQLKWTTDKIRMAMREIKSNLKGIDLWK